MKSKKPSRPMTTPVNALKTKVLTEDERVAQEMQQLRKMLTNVRKLPRDFRDLVPGGELWYAYMTAWPHRKSEMEAWKKSPVLVVEGPLCEEEWVDLGRPVYKDYTPPGELFTCSIKEFHIICEIAQREGCGWIYLAKCSPKIAKSANILLSSFGAPVRFRETLYDSEGRRLSHGDRRGVRFVEAHPVTDNVGR